MKIKRKTSGMVLLLFLICVIFGCGKESSEENAEKDLKNLVMYLIGTRGTDHEMVMDELNQKLQRDLGCTMTIKYISLGDYLTKYPLILSSGEQIDLVIAANWLNYSSLSQQGFFLPIEDLLKEYCPKTFLELDMESLKNSHPDGSVYMVPCNYVEPAAWGVIVRGDVMDELGYESINTMEEYFQFCIDVFNKTDYIDSSSQTIHLQDEVLLYNYGYCPVDGSSGAAYWFNVKRGDETGEYTVYNKYEVPELQSYFQNAKILFEEGAWSENALSNTNASLMNQGLAASMLHLPNRWVSIADSNPDADVRFYTMAEPVYVPSEHVYIGMAVPATSKYPEKALQFIELLHQDESYYNLLTCGIEGVHYEIDEETGELKLMNQGGYSYENGTWGFRNEKFFRETYGSPEQYDVVKKEIEDELYDNVFKNFLLNTSEIRAEYDTVNEVMEKEYTLMNMGYVDYKSGMEAVKKALKEAGNDICKAEIQRQVDAFIDVYK